MSEYVDVEHDVVPGGNRSGSRSCCRVGATGPISRSCTSPSAFYATAAGGSARCGGSRRTSSRTPPPRGRVRSSQLLVGTADDIGGWDSELTEDLPADVLEVAGADHLLEIPGHAVASAALLGELMDAVDDWIGETDLIAD